MKLCTYQSPVVVTAGANYLDIDAYACMIAMAELLRLQGVEAVAWSDAPCNYSVCPSLVEEGLVCKERPSENARYIIVDVSDPEYLALSVPLDRVAAVYDHHVGFEGYWQARIGGDARIEFIGAAATLIYRDWKKAGMQERMAPATARLLAAAILDNTLDLTSANTTQEDRDAFRELCILAELGADWRGEYFSEVQRIVERDLKNALLGDLKTVRGNPVLPPYVAQLCVWDAESILARLEEIRGWFSELPEKWMINIIELKHRRNYFVCDDFEHQKKIGSVFQVSFAEGTARTAVPYLRKELIRKTYNT